MTINAFIVSTSLIAAAAFFSLAALAQEKAPPAKPELKNKIGPEFTFGLTLDADLDVPVLIIKTARGGQSLYYDFRPASAGVYQRTPKGLVAG